MFDFAFVDLCLNLLHHMQGADLEAFLSKLEQKINQHQQQQMHQSSMEQYFVPICRLCSWEKSTNPPGNIRLPYRILSDL